MQNLNYVLFTDTDTDITPKIAEEYGYNLISMPYTLNEKETYPYVDFDVFDGHSLGALGNVYTNVSDEFLIKEMEKFEY